MIDLTREELEFLLGLLEGMQISGTAEQVRAVLKLRDETMRKLGRSAGKVGEEEGARKGNKKDGDN